MKKAAGKLRNLSEKTRKIILFVGTGLIALGLAIWWIPRAKEGFEQTGTNLMEDMRLPDLQLPAEKLHEVSKEIEMLNEKLEANPEILASPTPDESSEKAETPIPEAN